MNRGSIEIILIGGQEKTERGLSRVYLFPLIPLANDYKELNRFLPTFNFYPPELTLVSKERLIYFWR
ncbi:hypothetical protein ACQV2W_02820 [Facklamia sp. P12934]|uniref:hypothetical protein n=1 Tax=Facklamia sp. P12934 TaxID=3421948 RepID=UPI003D168852